jgi:hypothetical protein
MLTMSPIDLIGLLGILIALGGATYFEGTALAGIDPGAAVSGCSDRLWRARQPTASRCGGDAAVHRQRNPLRKL